MTRCSSCRSRPLKAGRSRSGARAASSHTGALAASNAAVDALLAQAGVLRAGYAAALPWLWEGTGLSEGMTFGEFVGGFGTEIDATTPDSPAGTVVVAEMVDIFGPGRTAQMAYYESRGGARVFSAGALDFGGSVTFWPMRRMLENVWRRLTTR